MYSNLGLKYWNVTDEIPWTSPMLDRWLKNEVHGSPLKDVTILLIQHQLGNHLPQAVALLELGVKPEKLFWIDIPYTSTPEVRAKLLTVGIPEKNLMAGDFKLLDDYGAYQRLRIINFLHSFENNKFNKLVVLDDGSYMLEACSVIKNWPKNLAIVEQTTRGIIKLEENLSMAACADQIPVINVARSWPKIHLEPPFIGLSVCEGLQRKLEKIGQILPDDQCLVLGYGAIGAQVANFLRDIHGFSGSHIHIYDPLEDRLKAAIQEGFSIWERGNFKYRFRLVIGCSGRASLRLGDYILLEDGAYLVSATSGSVELSRKDFIEQADSSPFDDIWIDRSEMDLANVHSDIHFHFIDREATFINGGFPVNFDGRINNIPLHYIQPTAVMMCAAAVQASRSYQPGLQDLDAGFCNWITKEFLDELGEESIIIKMT